MRPSHLPFILAALAVTSTATAHSWEFGSLVGTLKPGTVKCDDTGCTATLRAERIQTEYVDYQGPEIEVKALFRGKIALADQDRAETWPDARSALLAIGSGRVRLRGEFDWLDGGRTGELNVERTVRMRSGAPTIGTTPMLFPACGAPPWSQATLQGCYVAATSERRITLHATLETDAHADMRDTTAVSFLDLEDISVEEQGVALAPAAPYEIARVGKVGKLVNPTTARATLRTLRAGDRLTLEGAYVLPAPASLKKGEGAGGSQGGRYWPRLVVASVAVSAGKK
jgi:hypothetical protein